MHQFPAPGKASLSMEESKDHHSASLEEEKSKYLCPTPLRVTKENTTQCSTGCDDASTQTERTDRAAPAPERALAPHGCHS